MAQVYKQSGLEYDPGDPHFCFWYNGAALYEEDSAATLAPGLSEITINVQIL